MEKKLFEELLESMRQHEEIRRRERTPSREFHFDASRVKEMGHASFEPPEGGDRV